MKRDMFLKQLAGKAEEWEIGKEKNFERCLRGKEFGGGDKKGEGAEESGGKRM